ARRKRGQDRARPRAVDLHAGEREAHDVALADALGVEELGRALEQLSRLLAGVERQVAHGACVGRHELHLRPLLLVERDLQEEARAALVEAAPRGTAGVRPARDAMLVVDDLHVMVMAQSAPREAGLEELLAREGR